MKTHTTIVLLATSACLALAGCATNSAPANTQVSEAQTASEVADQLSATNNVSKSADGELICKRQSVVGSNFKRKICATAEQWAAEEDASRSSVGNMQRRGNQPGRSN